MTFLQPLALFGLLLALAPIVIHLLNLLRHRTQPWAATRFLFQARKSSSRISKLKRWITLLFRMLALAALAFMIARPMTGGDSLFSFSSGSPEVLVLVLDRSASMETRTEKDPQTKRAKALDAFQAFAEPWTESRLVVIDTALEDPFFIDKAASVKDAALERFFGPTDTSADLPGTLSKALDWLEKSGVGTAEILLASDMQISNWNLDRNSEVMEKINRILVQKKDLWKLNLLNLDDAPPYNLSMTLDRVNRMPGRVEPVVNLNKSGQGNERLRLSVNTNGSPGNIDLELTSPSMLWRPTFDLENEPEEGWISILGPDDFCQPDNACYLAYGVTTPPQVAVRAYNPRANLVLRSASQSELGKIADSLPLKALEEKQLLLRKVLIHQGKFEEGDEEILKNFALNGATIVLFPPESANSSPSGFLSWGALEKGAKDEYFEISGWRKDSGLLANSSDGNRLPVDRLNIKVRRIPAQGEPLAYYSDGKPFLTSMTVGKGVVYAFSTLPVKSWSELDNGYVLVPALQRLIEETASSNSFAQSWACGGRETKEAELFESIGGETDRVPSLHAGIYKIDGRLTAVNRPQEENERRFHQNDEIMGKLPGVSPRIVEDESSSDSTDRSEIWSFFLLLCLVLLLGEAFLGQPAATSASKAISSHA
ncbi:MAG: BatA domain-containing protein [Opitutae bacterium]